MGIDELQKRVHQFLKEFGFTVLEWDGVEITVRHTRDGEPFAKQEFHLDTPTYQALEKLEAEFQGIPPDFRHEI